MADYLDAFEELVDIVARLRAPGGCPWDREQTHQSLREGLLEECYEVLAALDEPDPAKLKEELGDLLLHVVFHTQLAAEAGEFKLGEVISGINRKLISRHPHVFGEKKVKDAGEVVVHWEKLKKAERGEGVSALDSVPAELPALAYGQSVQTRAARLGFDWQNTGGVIAKLAEEVGEFQDAPDNASRAAEFGDLLFTMVNVGRRLGINSETVLREANRRFYRRFKRMEELARGGGKSFDKLTADEQNALWEEAKRLEG